MFCISVMIYVFIRSEPVSLSGGLPLLGGGKLSLQEIYDSPTNLPPSDFALPQPVPRLVLAQSTNITAVQGRAALLNCRVRGIGNRTVSYSALLSSYFIFLYLRKYRDLLSIIFSCIKHLSGVIYLNKRSLGLSPDCVVICLYCLLFIIKTGSLVSKLLKPRFNQFYSNQN